MYNGCRCWQIATFRSTIGCAAAIVLLLNSVALGGCSRLESNHMQTEDYNVFDTSFTTNGVPISIDVGTVQFGIDYDGMAIVHSFPEQEDETANGDGNGENNEGQADATEPDRVKMVFMILPYDTGTEPDEGKKPVRHFRVMFDANEGRNWVELRRDQNFPIRFQYKVRPRQYDGTDPKPGKYFIAAIIVDADSHQITPPNEDEEKPRKAKQIAVFEFIAN